MAPALSRPTPRFALSHSARKPEIARSPRRYESLRVCAVAEFVGKAAGTRSEALLIHKFTAHTSSLAAALVLRDTGQASGAVALLRLPASLAACLMHVGLRVAGAGAPWCRQGFSADERRRADACCLLDPLSPCLVPIFV